MSDKKILIFSYIRMLYIASRIVFLLSAFVFFAIFLAIASGFYGNVFTSFFLVSYIGLVVSFGIFGGCFLMHFLHTKVSLPLLVVIASIPLGCVYVFLSPIW